MNEEEIPPFTSHYPGERELFSEEAQEENLNTIFRGSFNTVFGAKCARGHSAA